jgi:predicted O-methyltransferase YrrM
VQDKQTAALRLLNDKLVRDPRISFSMVPVGDGMALCRRRE